MASGSSYPPVVGVTFETLCRVMADVSLRQMQTGQLPTEHSDERDISPFATAAGVYGIDSTSWMRAQLVWGCRAILDPSLGIEQGQTMGRLMMPDMPQMPAFAAAMMRAPAPPSIDPRDPALAPIDGVTIESYVRMVATQTMYPQMTPEQSTEMAVQIGFPADRWEDVHSAWSNRVMAGPPVSIRYAELVCVILA